jgi:homoserine dehydrogenase
VAKRELVLGLAGLGTVGSGLARILHDRAAAIEARTGRAVRIKTILVRDPAKPRPVEIPGASIVTDASALIDDPEIDVVVELIGGTTAAYDLVHAALSAGKHVVTANKALLAERGVPLFRLAGEKGLHLAHEASVAGGIPIIETLKESLAANRIEKIMGILNGTANYILTRMTEAGLGFDAALAEAQARGYAEADPTLDVEGGDTAHKLVLLIRLAFGRSYPMARLPVWGVSQVSPMDIAHAAEFGYTIKLIAQAREVGGKIEAGVYPALIPAHYLLASVNGSFNAVRIEGDAVGQVMLYGRGAGDMPTGSAVAADVMAIARGRAANNTGFVTQDLPEADILDLDEAVSCHYLRFLVPDRTGVLRDLSGVMADHGISLEQVVQKKWDGPGVQLVFFTHECPAGAVHAAMRAIEAQRDLTLAPIMHYRIL